MGVKLAVVGGGSTYTPELIEGITNRGDRLPVDELVLLDIDPERLEVVGGLAQRMLARLGWGGMGGSLAGFYPAHNLAVACTKNYLGANDGDPMEGLAELIRFAVLNSRVAT